MTTSESHDTRADYWKAQYMQERERGDMLQRSYLLQEQRLQDARAEWVAALNGKVALRTQRDALLALIKKTRDEILVWPPEDGSSELVDELDAAINATRNKE